MGVDVFVSRHGTTTATSRVLGVTPTCSEMRGLVFVLGSIASQVFSAAISSHPPQESHPSSPPPAPLTVGPWYSGLPSGDRVRLVEPGRSVRRRQRSRGRAAVHSNCNRRYGKTSTNFGAVRPGRQRACGAAGTRSVPGERILLIGGKASLFCFFMRI